MIDHTIYHWSYDPILSVMDSQHRLKVICGQETIAELAFHTSMNAVTCPECRAHPEFKRELLRRSLQK
jgi:hypothetical protein